MIKHSNGIKTPPLLPRAYWIVLLNVYLSGCSHIQLPTLPSIPAEIPAHIERATRHTGAISRVEQRQEDEKGVVRLQLIVEGNSLIPTIDVERTFQEEMLGQCKSNNAEEEKRHPKLMSRQTELVNTWAGAVYRIVGTIICETPTMPPTTPSQPPIDYVPPPILMFTPEEPPLTKVKPPQKRPPKKRIIRRKKSKGCQCTKPEEAKPNIPFLTPPSAPKKEPTTTPSTPTPKPSSAPRTT